ncbi:MAG: NAD(P)-dependent oxidoreductase [bacterium]|nr:NAD(P)-dependent oxidoreductase [bacterium]
MNETKIIILGANGYIGRHLAKLLHEDGISMKLYDIQPESADPETADYYAPLDILDKNAMAKIDWEVNRIFVMSGKTGTTVGFKQYEEFIAVNEIGILNLLDILKKTGSKARIIFPSSRLVYKGQRNRHIKEEDEKEFKTVYALNKYASENYLKMYNRAFGIDYTVLRVCVPYGNLLGDYSYGTMGFLLGRAKKGENIPLYGDGTQRRTFTHVYDICRAIINAAFHEGTKNETYNIGGDHLSLLELAHMVAQKYGVAVVFSKWPDLDHAIESGDTMFDSSKLDDKLNHRRQYKITDWLETEC